MQQKVISYFKRYPQSNDVYMNNNVLFHTKGGADSFSKSETIHFTRKEVESKQVEVDSIYKTDVVVIDMKPKSTLEIVSSDEDISNYKQSNLLRMCKELELTTENNKAETLIIALMQKRVELQKTAE